MNDNNCKNDKLFGVDCDVVNCKFHSVDNCCHAEHIAVQSSNAMRKAETFCGTFSPRASM